MKEHGVLFKTPMVQAIDAGRKTMTRRTIRVPEGFNINRVGAGEVGVARNIGDEGEAGVCVHAKHGPVGRRIIVRETWMRYGTRVLYRARDEQPRTGEGKLVPWRSPLIMPRSVARIVLEVTEVRVERVRHIPPSDIWREGAIERSHDDPVLGRCPVSAFDGRVYPDLMSLWRAGWISINGAESWERNDWVFAYTFKRIE